MLIAEYDGERVYPSEFPNQYYDINSCDEDAEAQPSCPECGEAVTHRSQSKNGRTAHFAHCPDSGSGCSGSSVGESDIHDTLKSVAVSAVEGRIPLDVAESDTEQTYPAKASDTQAERTFDAVVEFADPHPEVGEGIVIEVQYENKSKNKQATTKDVYALDEDWTVLWLYEEDFDMSAQEAQKWRLDLDCSITERIRSRLWPSNNKHSLFTAADAPVSKIAECQDIFAERPVHTEFNYIHDEFCETEHTRVTFAGTVVDSIAQELKEATPWGDLFPGEPQFRDLYEYKMLLDHRKELPAPKIAGTAVDEIAQEVKNAMPWSYFTTSSRLSERYIGEVRDSTDQRRVPVTIPKHCIDVSERRELSGEDDERAKRGADVSIEVGPCPDCGYKWKASSRSVFAKCPSCYDAGLDDGNGDVPTVPVKPEIETVVDDGAIDGMEVEA